MRRAGRNTGFTLLELIVVIGLMGVITTLGAVVFSKFSDLWKQTVAHTDLVSKGDDIFAQMRQDFTEVVSAKQSGASVKGTTQAAHDSRFFKVNIEDDQVVIPVEIVAGPEGRPQRLDVKYYIDRKDGAAMLMRASSVPGGKEATTVKVADGVLAMAVEYAGHGAASAWKREWKESGSPAAVRVSVTLMDPVQTNEQIACKAVFPIEVN